MTRDQAITLVHAERDRQTTKWAGEHDWGAGDCSSRNVEPITKAAVLAEECGEVARAVLDGNDVSLRAELAQVAAVALAWLESM